MPPASIATAFPRRLAHLNRPSLRRLTAAAAVVAAALPAAAVAAPGGGGLTAAGPGTTTPPSVQPFVPGELLVRFRESAGASARASARRAVGARTARRLPVRGLELLRLRRGEPVREAVGRLSRRGDVVYAEPNYRYEYTALPNDPQFPSEWGLHNTGQPIEGGPSGRRDADIDAPQAWDLTTGSRNVVVAVADSGIAYDHPDLAANVWSNPGETGNDADGNDRRFNGNDDDGNGRVDDWRGWDFEDEDNRPFDLDGHGTHVAGTIGAQGNNGEGVAGVNWQVQLMPIRLGTFPTAAGIAAGFDYASDNGAKAVNASFGGPRRSLAVADAMRSNPRTLYIAASGNDGVNVDRDPRYPCAERARNLVCVGAMTRSGRLPSFSNYGRRSVDLIAPGHAVVSNKVELRTAFSDDFEQPLEGRWTTGGVNNKWGRAEAGFQSPNHSLADSPDGRYDNNTESWAQTGPVELNAPDGCRVDWWTVLESEEETDLVHMQASPDGNDWRTLVTLSGFGMGMVAADLASLSSGSAYVRFLLTTDSSRTFDGVYLDDVSFRCAGGAYGPQSYVFEDGTSMSAPHTSGVAGLLWARYPGAPASAVKRRLIRRVDKRSALKRRIGSSGSLNAFKALRR